jgi:hypothetical protein
MNDTKSMLEMRKSPFLAGLLSLLPGLGQVYVGYYVSGFVNVVIVGATITALNSMEGHHGSGEPFLGIFLAFFWLFNIIDAVRKANLYNLYQLGEKERPAPTDSPLVGGIVLVVAGLLFAAKFTFGLDMDWLQQVWPLALLIGGAYLIWKYRRTKRQMRGSSEDPGFRG